MEFGRRIRAGMTGLAVGIEDRLDVFDKIGGRRDSRNGQQNNSLHAPEETFRQWCQHGRDQGTLNQSEPRLCPSVHYEVYFQIQRVCTSDISVLGERMGNTGCGITSAPVRRSWKNGL